NARDENRRYRPARFFTCAERYQHEYILLRISPQFEHNLGYDTQRSFAATDQLCEIVTRRVLEYVRASPDDLTGGKDHFKVKDIIAGNAVLDRLWSPGVVGEIASQETRPSACRVRRIKQTLLFYRILKHFRDHTGLNSCLQVEFVYTKDAVETFHRHDDSLVNGKRASRE